MLLAELPIIPPEFSAFIKEFGSFGVIILMLVWFFWKGYPQALAMFDKLATTFAEEQSKAREAEKEARKLDIAEREQHRREAAERSEKHVEGLQAVSEVLSSLVHFVRAKLGEDERYGVSSQIDSGDSGRFPKPKPPRK